MSLNPDPKKQAQEVIFSPKSKAILHPPLVFNNNNIIQTASQKHHGIILDTRLPFEKHLETALCKINKTIGLIRKLLNILPRTALITLHKAFICPHLDYGDIIYDQAHNASFHQKICSTQCLFGSYWSNTRFIKGETIPRTSFWIFTTTSLV